LPCRIGFGFDVHRLKSGRPFILGGITIPSDKGPDGHSDADVLIHAICDALLGASGLRDIGFHFPDTSAEFKDADSRDLLKKVCALIAEEKFTIGNIDATVCLEQPKINAYVIQMKESLAVIMKIDVTAISVKATTNEKMGYIGREEGIAAYAVALLEKS
jgi:2-C-methyl-D-erythritol 2,4-cyclodiphosphate synthase